jgi:alpha-mannosidase
MIKFHQKIASFCCIGFALIFFASPVRSQEKSRIYLAPDDHTDYFWTADDVQYRAAFLEMIDYYLDLADRTQDAPPEYQSRWNCDGSLWVWEYEKNKPAKDFDRLIKRIRDGHISMPMTALANTYGAQPAEAVIRGMYYAGQLERKHDLRFPMAVAMENQTLPLGLGSLWAGAGAKYSWRGVCACATKMEYKNFQQRNNEIYWWKGLDGSRVLMKWYSLGDNNASIGGYAEARKPRHAIDWVRTNAGFKRRHPFGTIGLFGQGWDDLKTLSDEFLSVAKEKTTADQQVIVSNEEDFFRDFEKHYGPRLASESLAYGNEWDLYCMSMAEQTSRVRRAVEKLRTAEALATIVSEFDPKFWDDRQMARDQAHMNLGLYWEHDWTADSSEELRSKRGRWQRKLSDQISSYVDELHDAGLQSVADRIPTKRNSHRFVVFNSLGWTRDGKVKLDIGGLPELEKGVGWSAIDVASGEPLAILSRTDDSLSIKVTSIPPVGYKVIELIRGKPAIELGACADTHVLENEFLKLSISDSGSIEKLIDKKTGKNLAGPNGLNLLRQDGSLPKVERHGRVGEIQGEHESSLLIEVQRGLPHTVKLTLPTNANWIEIENTIDGNFSGTWMWEFDFAIANSVVHHEEVGAILNAALVKNNGHYAAKNARYDWLSLGHFVDVRGPSGGVTLSNRDCAFFRRGLSKPRHLDADSSKITVLAGGQVDGPKLGIRHQGGDKKFTQRFAIRVGAEPEIDPVSSMRWAMGIQNPLVSREIQLDSKVKRQLPEKTYSFLSSAKRDDSAVLLWSLKPSEEGIGEGIIQRFWNVSNTNIDSSIRIEGLKRVFQTSHIETDSKELLIEQGAAKIKFAPQQMRSFRLKR